MKNISLFIICPFFIAISCNNATSSSESRKPIPDSSIVEENSGNSQTILYSGFLYPTMFNGLFDLSIDGFKEMKGTSITLDVLENVKVDSVESIPFYWVKTKQIDSKIPDFYISKFRLPIITSNNGSENGYDQLNNFAVFIRDSLEWKHEIEYSSVNLSDEESLWRYISIRINGDSISFLGGIQLINLITFLNDNNEVKYDFFFGDNFRMWYASKVIEYQSQRVNALYKVIESEHSVYIVAELNSEMEFGEISEILHSCDERNSERQHLLMELYDYLGY